MNDFPKEPLADDGNWHPVGGYQAGETDAAGEQKKGKEQQPAPDRPSLVWTPHCDYWEVRDEHGKSIRKERFIPER